MYVLIRKSGSKQDEQGQIANVETMLKRDGNYVPKEYWFTCTVPRANVSGNADYQRLLELVESNKVGTVYVETQDRFGTDDVSEFYTMLGLLRSHRSRLYDLTNKTDLTKKDDNTLMKTFIGAMKSTKERRDTRAACDADEGDALPGDRIMANWRTAVRIRQTPLLARYVVAMGMAADESHDW